MKKLLMLMAALTLSVAAWALPTVEQVKAQVNQGNYTQAESMMKEVVTARPDSAKGHYIYAEILAHNRRFEQAAQEARLARQLDSDIRFTKPEEFRSFEQMLERERQAAKAQASTPTPRTTNVPARVNPQSATPAESRSGIPGWVWGLGFAAIALVVWRMISARAAAPAPAAAGGGYYPGPGAAGAVGPGGYPAAPMGGIPSAGGSGLLGAGLAGAGGFAAGMLAEKLLHGQHDPVSSGTNVASNDGGLVPGMFDDSREERAAANDLENRSVDFGSGDDWGGGGSSDGGGGGGGSDDW
jgi:hypothetical protein